MTWIENHAGDVVEESDRDLVRDGVRVARAGGRDPTIIFLTAALAAADSHASKGGLGPLTVKRLNAEGTRTSEAIRERVDASQRPEKPAVAERSSGADTAERRGGFGTLHHRNLVGHLAMLPGASRPVPRDVFSHAFKQRLRAQRIEL